jgi:urease accessory protein
MRKQIMNRDNFTRSLMAIILLLAMQPLSAHTTGGAIGGLGSGLGHPFIGIDHLLAMLAVGMWAYQLGGSAVWKVPLVFVLTLLVGASVGLAGLSLPFIEPVIVASVMVFGLLIAMKSRITPVLASMLVALFALFHGYAHGIEMPLAALPLAYVAGFSLATIGIHVLGVMLAYVIHRTAQTTLLRVGGFGLAGTGLLLMVGA